jgi:hypothetical protein
METAGAAVIGVVVLVFTNTEAAPAEVDVVPVMRYNFPSEFPM